ncbi:MAG: arylsulfotransferase family protein [Gammaproteobacteria bacterium]
MNRFALIIPICALLFLSFVAGTFVMFFERFPSEHLERAYKALRAQYFVIFVSEDPTRRDWQDQRTANKAFIDSLPDGLKTYGVSSHDAGLAYSGYTIYSAGSASFPVQLIDMQGNPVHEWRLPVEQLSGPALNIELEKPQQVQIRRVSLQPDGSLLMVICYFLQHTPYGLGVVKLDRDSNILWQNLNNAHHDVDLLADGRIFVLTHHVESVSPEWPEGVKAPYIAETVTILDQDGNTLKTVSLLNAMREARYAAAAQYIEGGEGLGDIMHTNSIDVVEPDTLTHIPGAKVGDALISVRNSDTLVLLDTEQEKVTWAARGVWHRQHDADLLENGNILLFDNQGGLAGFKRTRILEIDPRTMGIEWQYPEDGANVMHSQVLGSQQRLPNGNTLITVSQEGRLLEVTQSGQLAWEFLLPQILIYEMNGETARADVYSGQRFSGEELDFEFNLQ